MKPPARGTTASPAPAHQSVGLAIAWMCLGSATLALMSAAVKGLMADFSALQVTWARYVGSLVFMAGAFSGRSLARLVVPRRWPMQLLRGGLVLSSTLFFFAALAYIPLAEAATLNSAAPLAVAALSAPILGERVSARVWIAIATGFLGVIVILRPGAALFQAASLLLVGSAATHALYHILTRKLSADDSPEVTVTISAVIGTAVTSIALPFFWRAPQSLSQVGLFAAVGIIGGLGHYLVARAYRHATAAVVSPFSYVQLLGAIGFGYLLFDQLPDSQTAFGALIIVGAGLYIGSARNLR